MESDKQLETSISQALLQVEKDLFLPHNTLVDTLSKDHKPYDDVTYGSGKMGSENEKWEMTMKTWENGKMGNQP